MSGFSGSTCAQLLERIDFDFNDHRRIGRAARNFAGNLLSQKLASFANGFSGRERRRAGLLAAEGQVVVFDQNGVVEPGAMIVAAAAVDGIFFQPPPAGRGLASVVNSGLRAGDGIDILAGERGDARQAAEQVQDDPLAGQQVASIAAKVCQHGSGVTASPS